MSYNLYETFTDLIVSKEDYTEAEVFTQQYLNALYPTLDLREGSPLRDIVIRPCATMIALVNKGVVKHFTDNTIAGATDATPTATVDALLSNFFLSRNMGGKTRILAQVRFSVSIPSNAVSIPVTTTFSVDNTYKYSPVQATTLSITDGTLRLYSDVTGTQYYFGNILLEAQDTGTASDVDVGQEFLFFTIFDPYFLGASVTSIQLAGVDAETNLEFISRAGNAISTRNLINEPSIAVQINAKFPTVKALTVSGYGDYEQFRDYRLLPLSTSPTPVPVHLGGFVDLYVNTSLKEKLVRVVTGLDGSALIDFPHPVIEVDKPALGVKATENTDGSPVEEEDATLIIGDLNDLRMEDLQYSEISEVPWEFQTGFSTKQRLKASSAGVPFPPNSTFDLNFLYWESIDSIQSFLDDPSIRVVAANYLARGYSVVEVFPTLRIVGGAPTDPDLITELKGFIVTSLRSYIEGLAPAEPFVFSEALAFLTNDITSYQFNSDVQFRSVLHSGKVQDLHHAISPDTGVIDSEYVTLNSSGHDETSTGRVGRTFVFHVRPQGVTLL